MRERFTDLIARIKEWWSQADKKKRFSVLAAFSGALLVSLLVVLALNYTPYQVVYSGASPQETANVLSVLGEMSISPKFSDTGAVMVPEKDANRVRMSLATSGLPNLDYDIYTQNAGMTATQQDKNLIQTYQLQDRLQAAIETFDEVAQAIVTVSMPQPSVYTLQRDTLPPTASVKLTMHPGQALTPQQVRGILNLVKNAISGLSEGNISITDDTGDLLMMNVGSSTLVLVEQVNSSIRSNALAVLIPIFGANNVQVAANAVLDTDSKVTEEITYQPYDETNPQNNPLQSAEYDREKIGGEFGVVEGVPGANDNVDVPQYSARDLETADATSYYAHDVYNYLVSSVKNSIVKEGMEITGATIAVIINSNGLPDGQRDQIIDLVAGATGVIPDNIRVQSMSFYNPPRSTALTPEGLELWQILLISGLVLALALTIFMFVYLRMRKKRQDELAAEAAVLAGDSPLIDLMREEPDFEPIQILETSEQKLKAQIKDLAQSDPEIVAQLIKTWLVTNH